MDFYKIDEYQIICASDILEIKFYGLFYDFPLIFQFPPFKTKVRPMIKKNKTEIHESHSNYLNSKNIANL